MKKLITPSEEKKVKEKLKELLLRSWKASRPFFPKMRLIFKEDFTRAILFHEGFHWNIYPVSVWRSLEETFKVRELLAEEEGFQPKKIQKGLYRTEEDWSGFKYTIAEIQFVQNILGDYLINWHIHDYYPTVWDALWNFLYKRDTTFQLYLAVYSHLIPGVPSYPLKTKEAQEKIEKIAKIVRACKLEKISTIYATRELVKLFHPHIEADFKQKGKGQGQGKGGTLKCPACGHDEFEITAYQDKNGNWVEVNE